MTSIIWRTLRTCLLVACFVVPAAALLPTATAAPNVPYTPCPVAGDPNPWAGWQWPGAGTAFYCPGTGMWCRNIGNGQDQCWYDWHTPVHALSSPEIAVAYPVNTHATYATVAKALGLP